MILATALLTFPAARVDGQTVALIKDSGTEEYPLDRDRTVSISENGISLSVEIKDGNARVLSADCPDRVCVHTGTIRKAGDVIVCAPAHVVIRILGGRSGGVDDVAQ